MSKNTKEYEKTVKFYINECPPGTEWRKAQGTVAIAYALLAVANAIENLTNVIKEK